jgi:hypothetical protein
VVTVYWCRDGLLCVQDAMYEYIQRVHQTVHNNSPKNSKQCATYNMTPL